MVKQIHKWVICSMALLVPATGMAHSYGTVADSGFEMVETVKIAVKGHSVRIQQAEGMALEVYSVTGAKVMSVRLESADQTVYLKLNRGCYILKVGDVARKVSLL